MRGRMTTPAEVIEARRWRKKSSHLHISALKKIARRKARRVDRQAIRMGNYEKVTLGLNAWKVD